jgi:hypothetical protein
MHCTLTLNSPTGRIRQESEDSSTFNHEGTVARIRRNIESAMVATTLQDSNSQKIEKIISEREPFIIERNRILDNPIKYLFYRKKLREIDAKLDALDLQIFLLETENSISESELNEVISTAEAKLKKYSKYLHTK